MAQIEPIRSFPYALDRALLDFIAHVVTRLVPIGEADTGYGETLVIESDADTGVRMHRFCWCDHPDCPWCGTPAEASDAAQAGFTEAGYVPGEGAPNFWLRLGEIDLRVWWYKYIGRSMAISGIETEEDLAKVRSAFDAWADAQQDLIWQIAARETVWNHLGQMPEPLCAAIADAFSAQMAAASDKPAMAKTLEELLPAMGQAGHASAQYTQIDTLLRSHAVPTHMDDDSTPEELRMHVTLATQLGWLFRHVDVEKAVTTMRQEVTERFEPEPAAAGDFEEPADQAPF